MTINPNSFTYFSKRFWAEETTFAPAKIAKKVLSEIGIVKTN